MPMSARLVHVITDFRELNGAEAWVARLVSAMPHVEHHIVSLRSVSDVARAAVRAPGVTFHAAGVARPFQLGRAVACVARVVAQVRPVAVQCWMYHGNVVGLLGARRAGHAGPVFWSIRGALESPAVLSASSRLALLAGRALSRRADRIIYPSVRARLQHRRYGYDATRDVVIPNGFELPPPRPRTAARAGGFVVGTASRFHPAKDHPLFLAAVAMLMRRRPDVRVRAAGRGVTADNPEFLRLVDAAGLDRERLELFGQVTDMPAFYRGLDAFVLTSASEAFPNVLAEAMACGVPCVTTDVGDAAEIVGTLGEVVRSRQPDDVAMAIERVIARSTAEIEALRPRLAQSIRERYAMDVVTRTYLSLYGIAAPDVAAAPILEEHAS